MTTGLKSIDYSFSSANELDVPERLRRVVRNQPGYRRGAEMRLHPTVAGSQFIRLYVRIPTGTGQWTDGSLQDIYPVA